MKKYLLDWTKGEEPEILELDQQKLNNQIKNLIIKKRRLTKSTEKLLEENKRLDKITEGKRLSRLLCFDNVGRFCGTDVNNSKGTVQFIISFKNFLDDGQFYINMKIENVQELYDELTERKWIKKGGKQ